MAALTKAAILAAQDLAPVRVPVKAWGGEVLLQPFTAGAREQFVAEAAQADATAAGAHRLQALMLALCLVDEQGQRLFVTDEEIAALNAKSAAVVAELFAVASRINGLGQEAEDAAGKGSTPAPTSSSATSSPSTSAG